MEAAYTQAIEDYHSMLHLPMSTIAVQQSVTLLQMLTRETGNHNIDSWIFKWSSGKYSTKKYTLS